jgi:hypothetical protein
VEQKPVHGRATHRHYELKRAISEIAGKGSLVDGRSSLGRALQTWRTRLTADLGDDLSEAQQMLVELVLRTRVMLDHIDAYLMSQGSLINRRRKQLLPVVVQRTALADQLARLLGQLGLERRQKRVPSLSEILAGGADGDR